MPRLQCRRSLCGLGSNADKGFAVVVTLCAVCWAVFFLWGANDRERHILTNTLALGGGAAAVALLLGGVWAWVLLTRRGVMVHIGTSLTMAAAVLPPFLYVAAWDAAFGKLGWLTTRYGIPYRALLGGWPAGIWISGVTAAPVVALFIYIYMRQSGRRYEEAALLDASPARVFWSVTMVRLRPVLILAALWTFVTSTREIAVTDLFQLRTLAEQIYLGFALNQPEQVFALWPANGERGAVAMVLITVMGIAVLLLAGIITWAPVEWSGTTWRDRERVASHHQWAASTAMLLMLLVFAGAPLFNLVLRAGQQVVEVDGQPRLQFAWSHLWNALAFVQRSYGRETGCSLTIGAGAAISTLCGALLLAWLATRSRTGFMFVGMIVCTLLALPGPLIGYGLYELTVHDWGWPIQPLLDRSLLLPIVAATATHLPVATVLVWYLVRQTPRQWYEQAAVDGYGPLGQLLHVFCPANGPSLVGLALLVGILSFGELSASWIVLPPGYDSVPRLMLGLMHAGVDNVTSAIGLWLGGAMLISSFVAAWLIRWPALHRMP